MKKALSVFLMAAMAFGAFADEPVADVKVSEFTGNAAVTWGVDLDSGKTGFKNDAEATLKLNLLNGGNKSTSGDGVWGELVIKTDGDTFVGWNGNGKVDANKGMGEDLNFGVKVDTAKIHIGPAYVGILAGDTQVGKLELDAAVRSGKTVVKAAGAAGYTQGIVAGFDSDVVKVDVDIRSVETAQYTNEYAMAAEAELKAVENLSVKAGVSYELKENGLLGYGVSAGYKLAIDDTFYLRPQVGFTGNTAFNSESVKETDYSYTLKENTSTMEMAAGVLFGWGATEDKNPGVYFLNSDNNDKKRTPGVSLVAAIPLPTVSSAKSEATAKWGDKSYTLDTKGKETSTGDIAVVLKPSVYSGELIPGLTVAAYAEIEVTKAPKTVSKGTRDEYDFDEQFNIKVVEKDYEDTETGLKPDGKVYFAAGAKYAIGVDALTITPQAGVEFKNKAAGDSVKVQAGVDVAGLIDNTTLSAVWTSNNLNDDKDTMGKLNFKAKISF